MKKKFGMMVSFLSVLVAVFILIYTLMNSIPATAQSSAFANNLPAGYTVYPGGLIMSKSCSCSSASITGAPAPPPPCNTTPCFGSSYTRYGWIVAKDANINSRFCLDLLQVSQLPVPPCFQLDGDDAIVISGNMAPVKDISFYSYTFYQSFKYNPQFTNNYGATAASINLNLNKANLKMGNQGKYVVIVTANTTTLNVVKQALREIGTPDSIMNTYLVPAQFTNVGINYYPDQLSLLLRLTSQSTEERQQVDDFSALEEPAAADPATKVIIIKGPGLQGDVTEASLPKWEDQLRSTPIEYTLELDQKLAQLEQNVVNSYLQQGYRLKTNGSQEIRLTQDLIHVEPAECIGEPKYCAYDAPDAIYTAFPCDFAPGPVPTLGCNVQIGRNSDDVLMLLGVEHSLVGATGAANVLGVKPLAAYISFESRQALGSNDSGFSFVGAYTRYSANQYIQGKDVNKLYAVKIARNCDNQLFCAAIPFKQDTPEAVGFHLLGRIYLDKNTGTAPNPANLVPARLLWFTKNQ